MKTKQKNYIDNEKLLEALIKYKYDKQQAILNKNDPPPIPNYIGECWIKIAEHYSQLHCFINYSYRDEMISDGIENCLMYFDNFNPEKSKNPFAYFTQIIYYTHWY